MTDNLNIWSETVLSADSTIREAVEVLNKTSLKIILVISPNKILIGTISDGDIRRGLLRGLELASSIDSIVNKDALVVLPGLPREDVLQLMVENKIQQIPIVDEKKLVVGLHLWDQLSVPVARANLMVIMAGGKGSRLHPQTENCPKPLLQVGGKPILEHIIDRAKAEGFSRFVLAIHHLGHMIEEYFGDGKAFGVDIDYLREESALGTAGALSLLNPWPESAFVVTNGDVLTDIHYGGLLDFHTQYNAVATMAVRIHDWQNPFGVVELRGMEIVGYEEKPIVRTHINAGVYVVEPYVIGLLTRDSPLDMPALFELVQKQEMKAIAYPIYEPWIDIGRPSDFLRASSGSKN